MSDEKQWTTVSGIPLKASYGPDDVPAAQVEASSALPGAAPKSVST